MKKLIFSILCSLVLAPFAALIYIPAAQAQTSAAPATFCQKGSCTYVALEPLPGLPDCYGPNPPITCTNSSTGSFQSLIGKSFKLLMGAGATIAVVMLVLGALTYMFSDVIGNKSKALDRIRNAMWAIVILVSSYLILNTINPDLVSFQLNLVSPAPGTTPPTQKTSFDLSNYVPATQPNNTVASGQISDNITKSVCNGELCDMTSGYIVYDPSSKSAEVQTARDNFITQCESSHYVAYLNRNSNGKVVTFPGSVANVNSTGMTGAACVLQ